MSLDSPDEVPIWYAMSAPYREMKVADYLKTHQDIKVFLPLERCERMVGQHIRKRVISYRLVVRNLLFVKATPGRMRDLKQIYNSMLQFANLQRKAENMSFRTWKLWSYLVFLRIY